MTKDKLTNSTFKKIQIAIFFLLSGLLIFKFFPSIGKFQYTYEEGSPWKYENITAPFAFDVFKSAEETKAEQDSILKDFYPCYNFDTSIATKNIEAFRANIDKAETMDAYSKYVTNKLIKIYEIGIISPKDVESLSIEKKDKIMLKIENVAKTIAIDNFLTTKSAYEQIIADLPSTLNKDILRSCDINKYLSENIVFDNKTTDRLKNEITRNISLTKGRIQSGEKIIDHGEIITKERIDILNSLKQITMENREDENTISIAWGQAILIVCMLSIFFAYLLLYSPTYLHEPKNIFFLLSLCVSLCFLTHFATSKGISHYYIPYAMLPVVISIFFDTRIAFFLHTITILLCSFIVTSEYEFLFLQISIGMISTCSLKNLYQRSQLIWSALIITVSYILLYCGENLIHERSLEQVEWSNIFIFVINGLFLLLCYPFIYIFEKLFGYISDVTLVELSNTNNSLLRKFSEEAPGSFQHSIQVSNLAAFVAQNIGANPMLARTGALYHDIGKMKSPNYFTENQMGVNIHNQMNDEEKSAQIIISHVADGIAIGKKNNLPQKLLDFIQTHHGKSKCKYFYTTFKNKYPEKEINESIFTYPGPLPFSKEMAVVAMCDSIEAASRSLSDYTETSINNLVEKIVTAQVSEGLYNDAPLTMQDIEYSKKLIKEKLKTMYHTRISYPELNKKE